ncbi:MAG: hypothetical protein K2P81_05230 [Bacteriovoracaceae bacterium]|nr:hypothetical protein [Bacteriovoracaceae bacterium]
MINLLEDLGGHVLVVPNLLSPSYISSHPLYKEDPIALEIQVMEQAVDFAQGQIKENVSQIYVVAESLGTAIASAWVAYDTQHKKRVHDLTLLWPPMDLSYAMKNFDAIIDEHRPSTESCSVFTKVWAIGREFLLQEYPSSLSKEEEFCLGGLVLVDGFVKATQRSWSAHNEIVKSNLSEPVGFEDFFRKYRPELWKLLEAKDKRLRLEHWLREIRLAPDFHLRIMTSQNDFLNRGLDWKKLKDEFKLSNNELVIIPWGGHSGPVGMSIFPQILNWTFNEANGKSYNSH